MSLKEVRCTDCKKLLGKFKGEAEVKCPRCKKTNLINTERQTSAG